MSDIHNWSTLASENNRAPPDGWPENTMTFGQVNNTGREMMAVICRWFQDTCGVLLATGLHYDAASNAYGYRLNTTRNVPIDLTTRVRFRIPQTNVGATWLSVNGSFPAYIKWPDNSQCLANDLTDVVDVYWHGGGVWMLNNVQRRSAGSLISGVQMLFAMQSAPTGWTQSVAWHDRVIRVVNHAGTGGGGSWIISGLTAETANHTHNVTVSGSVAGSTSTFTPLAVGINSAAQYSVVAKRSSLSYIFCQLWPKCFCHYWGIEHSYTYW